MYWKLKYLTFLDHEPCAVNDGKRLMAYLVDWFLSGLCLSLPMCLAWMMATKDLDQMEKVNVFRLASVIGDGPAWLQPQRVCCCFYGTWCGFPGR